MNKLVTHQAVELSNRSLFATTFTSVETVTDEDAPFTFAVIFHNKHGRTNLSRVGGPGFLAGAKSKRAVMAYAKVVDPNTTEGVFLDGGRTEVISRNGVMLKAGER